MRTQEVVTLFNERAGAGGSAVLHFQNLIYQIAVTTLVGISLYRMMPGVTLLAVAGLALLYFPLREINRIIEVSGRNFLEEWDKMNHRLILGIRNLLLLRIYGIEEQERTLGKKELQRYLALSMKYYTTTGFSFVAPTIAGVILIGIIASLNRGNTMAPGLFVSYFYLFFRFLQGGSTLSMALSNFRFSFPQLKYLYDWWLKNAFDSPSYVRPNRYSAVEDANANAPHALGWNITNVSFGYDPSKPLFKDFSLSIPSGSATAVVGPSGTGKSTLLNLLIGELEPLSGKIQVTLNASQKVDLSRVRRAVCGALGYVGPEPFVIDGSIRENLQYGLGRACSDEQLHTALKLAAAEFVNELAGGLRYRITEQGVGLSAGQKQRLSLARALLRKPKALILDEPTANVDSETEAQLIETLKLLKGSMTLVIVTHREALLKIADQVLQIKPDQASHCQFELIAKRDLPARGSPS
jgi:ABC-type multidrug transport system fused ATPase/permease subunit